jgi:hypothetical protein
MPQVLSTHTVDRGISCDGQLAMSRETFLLNGTLIRSLLGAATDELGPDRVPVARGQEWGRSAPAFVDTSAVHEASVSSSLVTVRVVPEILAVTDIVSFDFPPQAPGVNPNNWVGFRIEVLAPPQCGDCDRILLVLDALSTVNSATCVRL